MSTDRDALAEVLGEHFVMWHDMDAAAGPPGEWRCGCGAKFGFSGSALVHQADALLASPQFASLIAEAKAEAWDEGYEMGYDDALFDERGLPTDLYAAECPHENPYRAALAATRDTDQAEEATDGGE